ERADVGMGELRDRLRFPLEALPPFGGSGQMRWENLDRDGAVEPRVARLVHIPHPARPDGRLELVRSQTGAWRDRHRVTEAPAETIVPPRYGSGYLAAVGVPAARASASSGRSASARRHRTARRR